MVKKYIIFTKDQLASMSVNDLSIMEDSLFEYFRLIRKVREYKEAGQ